MESKTILQRLPCHVAAAVGLQGMLSRPANAVHEELAPTGDLVALYISAVIVLIVCLAVVWAFRQARRLMDRRIRTANARLRAERDLLADQRQRLDSLMHTAPAVIYSARLGNRELTYISPNFTTMLGYAVTPDVLEVRWWSRRIHPEDQTRVGTLEWTEWEQDQHVSSYRFLHADGSWRWIEDRCRLIRDGEGIPRERVGSLADITERVELETRLEREQQRANLAMAGANLGLWEWQLKGDQVVFNDRWAAMLGYKPEEVVHTMSDAAQLVHPQDRRRVREALVRHLTGQADSYQAEYRMRHRDGHWVWVLDRGRVMARDADGKALRASGTHLDITELYLSRELLRESEEKFRSLYEYAPIGIMLNRLSDGRFVEVNDAILKLTGYDQEQLLSMNFWELTPPEYADEEAAYYEMLNTCGVYGPYEKVLVCADGTRLPVQVNGSLTLDRHGEAMVWMLVQDISERQRAERLKKEFVSTVSHELRTPLTSIKGALGLLTGGAFGSLPDAVRHLLDIAVKNSDRLTLLINDLLDMEKIAAGSMRFDMQHHDLQPLLHQAIESNRGYAQQFQAQLILRDDLPGAVVRVDGDRFLQVMANLLSNAIKFSPSGGEVEIGVQAQGKRGVRITVKDQGPGVPEAFRQQLFNRFTQADSSDTRPRGGTGLGLAITRELIEHMGGQVALAESAEGQGACFYVDLPRAVMQEAAASTAERLLMVEARADVAMRLAALLHDAGYEAERAADTQTALEMLEEEFAAVTLDVNMEGVIDFMRTLRSDERLAQLPVIMVAASVDDGRLQLSADLEALDWLPKPVDRQRLRDALRLGLPEPGDGHRPRVLHVEDDMDLAQVLSLVGRELADFHVAPTLAEAHRCLAQHDYDVVVLDLALPDGRGSSLLPLLSRMTPAPAVVILSASDAEIEENEAARADVVAALVKSRATNASLLETLRRAIHHARGQSNGDDHG